MLASTLRRITWAVLTAAVILVGPKAFSEETVTDEKNNFEITLPSGWSRESFVAEWAKYGIVFGARHELDHLKGGEAAHGEGAQAHVVVTDEPEGQDLAAILADKANREFFLGRFEKVGDVESEIVPYDEGIEMGILRVDGKARNLKGKLMPSRGVMLHVLAKKKLYRLRLYAWVTEHDDEGLKSELDFVESQWALLSTKPDAPEPGDGDGPPQPPPEDDDPNAAPPGDSGEVKEIKHQLLTQGWRMTKPVGIQTKEYDPEEFPDVVAWFEGSDRVGSYQVIFSVYRRGRINAEGRPEADFNLRDWMSTSWWPNFNENHPEAEVLTYKWPRRAPSILTLPDLESPIMVAETPDKRPQEPDAGDLEKLKILEKVKGKIGEQKLQEAWRGALFGSRPRVGKELVLRFAFHGKTHTFMVTISIARDGLMKWAKPIQQLLESFTLEDR